MATWQLQDAKAKFSQVVREAQKSPQIITLRGSEDDGVVVISRKEYNQLRHREKPQSFTEFMRNSPLFGVDLDIERDQTPHVGIDFTHPDFGFDDEEDESKS